MLPLLAGSSTTKNIMRSNRPGNFSLKISPPNELFVELSLPASNVDQILALNYLTASPPFRSIYPEPDLAIHVHSAHGCSV